MSLFQHLSMVEENRSHINQRHALVDVLFLVLSAVASGNDGWAEIQQFGELKIDWLRQFRPFKHGIPKRHTIARIMNHQSGYTESHNAAEKNGLEILGEINNAVYL